jgi:hypothetical protein
MNAYEWGNAIDGRLYFMKLEPGIVRSRLEAYIFRELDVTERGFLTYNDVNLDADRYGDGPGRRTSPR